MKITNLNPLIITDSPEEMLPLYVKTMGFKITHNLEFPNVNLLVLEKDKQRIDIVVDSDPNKFKLFKKEYYAIRLNVDDYVETCKELLQNGCSVYINTVEVESTRLCVLKQPNGLLLGVMEHKKTKNKTSTKKVVKKKTVTKKASPKKKTKKR